MQRDPVVSKASELLRLGLMPSPSELRNGKVRNDRLLVTSSAGSTEISNVHAIGPIVCGYPNRGFKTESRVKVECKMQSEGTCLCKPSVSILYDEDKGLRVPLCRGRRASE